MDNEVLKQVIKETQEFKFPKIVPRDISVPLNSKKIITITGPRRSGKTYFLYSLMDNLLKRSFPRKNILYINFDDPRLLPFGAKDLETLLESFFELYPDVKDKGGFIFFDEIQNVKDWEIGVRRIYDTGIFRVFLTGSSSKFLSKEIATSLRGRAINYEILPFSFRETLLSKGIKIEEDTPFSKSRFAIKNILEEYLKMGGFPEIVLEKSRDLKIRILKGYLEVMFFKDLVERYSIKNQSVLRELIKYLISNISNLFSLNAFWKWIKQTYPIGKRTLINYVSYLEDIGLIFLIKKFSYSLKEQTQTPRKVYIVDNGLREIYGFGFSQDRGKILENTAFLELRHRQTKDPLMEIFYFQDRQKREVDFVIKRAQKIDSLIQVCTNIEDFKIRERETNALIKASEKLKCKNLKVITFDYESQEKIKGKKIIYKTLWRWLLGL